jgi:N-methylhydantoinase A/oxoprolinase/acetone carboxylase beta subunit
MLLGIDVGGTHTDAVTITDDGVGATYKVPTRHDDLLASVNHVLSLVAEDADPAELSRLNLSTTLTTNVLAQGTAEDVGMLVSAGPGLDPEDFRVCRHYAVIPGATDHRGSDIRKLDMDAAKKAVDEFRKDGVKVFGCVGKFSPKNPEQEKQLARACKDADFVTQGHEVAGVLGFPRRINTVYFNSAVWRPYNRFVDAVTRSLETAGFAGKVNVLKADGGTMPLEMSRRLPVESILSGPAASVMGIISMCDISLDSIILDIGGTTTDIAIFAEGAPLMEPGGISIGSHLTLVRALTTKSIPVGGDSGLAVEEDRVRVGPLRPGPAMAAGGSAPTLIDALNCTGDAEHGDVAASRRGIDKLAADNGMEPENLARAAAKTAVERIRAETWEMVETLNAKPVYTIHELLEDKKIVPRKIYAMGGPAKAFSGLLRKAFSLAVEVPTHYQAANAVGAALTRTTYSLELFADTQKQRLTIPALSKERIVEADFDLEAAKREAVRTLLGHLRDQGIPARDENVEIIAAHSFNMVSGMRSTGRDIRVRCQIRPGILHRYRKLAGTLC